MEAKLTFQPVTTMSLISRVTLLPKLSRLWKVIIFLRIQTTFQHKRSLRPVEQEINRNWSCFLVPGCPALKANKHLNPIDCSNAASASKCNRTTRPQEVTLDFSKQTNYSKRPLRPKKKSASGIAKQSWCLAQTQSAAPCFVSLVSQTRRDGGVRRASGRIEPRQHASERTLPGGPSPPALFETRSLTHSCSTPFKYFKRVSCGAITRLLDYQRVHPSASSYLLNLQKRARERKRRVGGMRELSARAGKKSGVGRRPRDAIRHPCCPTILGDRKSCLSEFFAFDTKRSPQLWDKVVGLQNTGRCTTGLTFTVTDTHTRSHALLGRLLLSKEKKTVGWQSRLIQPTASSLWANLKRRPCGTHCQLFGSCSFTCIRLKKKVFRWNQDHRADRGKINFYFLYWFKQGHYLFQNEKF